MVDITDPCFLCKFQDFAPDIASLIDMATPNNAHVAAREITKLGLRHANFSCGCLSCNAQMAAFGAALMKLPALISDIVDAMKDAARDTRYHISVKFCIGVYENKSPEFLSQFFLLLSFPAINKIRKTQWVFVLHAFRI
ncbi:hypothetical protein COEREDRAFT_7784 [Coemansia reversa NRRL 1564]|uniref:DUS-like FMN-binding domain-containing protein n=1 Tax=Coemansia reversa (strain ATCC 12441 / NRRL 1564) TaxID=763665 RepID=A0A2G5BDB9_COERN|nr:hypothetical protein COEREDRAFT_7779 [Coemansia reversa NRRL 1564]PIA17016.1 hypothetical protein COEREDRAFT_7784 [Coemansia reversa NRRL 1564]|eukprot:PIA17010.1 hypothetical protein COEREDRAFT_7779 [Coemansia reversa NRRL 1564]